MGQIIDIEGKKYGRLLVLGNPRLNHYHKLAWKCRCECGVERYINSNDLRMGKTVSCGCYQKANAAKCLKKIATTHGSYGTPLCQVWQSMKQRCIDKNYQNYKRYGGRGIAVCEEWRSNFSTFKNWALSNGYKKGLSIDRINNDGNYEPSNCRWSTVTEQGRNKSNNVKYKGETATEASRRLGGCNVLVHKRIENGWSLKRAFTIPVHI